MKKLLAATSIAAAGLLAGSSAVHASGYNQPEPEPETTIDDGTPEPGGQFTVTVTDCDPQQQVDFEYLGTEVTETADDAGAASASFTAPTTGGTTAGTATCGETVMSFSVTVPEPQPQPVPEPEPQPLPATGSGDNSTMMLALGGLLLLTGVGMFGVAQRRRSTLS